MVSRALYRVAEKGCLAPKRRSKSIHQDKKASQAVNTIRPASSKYHIGYKIFEKNFLTSFEPPVECCNLYEEEKYNCIIHPRDLPYEYYLKLLTHALHALKRSYIVDLFVFSKRCERDFYALHMERREKLGLQDLHEEEDFPRVNPWTRKEPKKLLEKLCIFHKLDCNIGHCPRGTTEFLLCKCDLARKRHRQAHRQLYADYRSKVFNALEKFHKAMGYNLFKINDPAINPRKEWDPDVTRANKVLMLQTGRRISKVKLGT